MLGKKNPGSKILGLEKCWVQKDLSQEKKVLIQNKDKIIG